jgi:hypothetical protein
MLKADITDKDISHYEGVVRQTAGMFFAMVEEEFEDVCQILRMKAWRALVSFDVDKATAGKGLLHRQGDQHLPVRAVPLRLRLHPQSGQGPPEAQPAQLVIHRRRGSSQRGRQWCRPRCV